jgi:hypothetical protein
MTTAPGRPFMRCAAQLGAAPDFEPRVAVSQVRYHFACGSKPVSFERWTKGT